MMRHCDLTHRVNLCFKQFHCEINLTLRFLSETLLHRPGFPEADTALLYPPPLSPDPISPLTHLGTLPFGHDAARTGGWDR